MFAIENIADKTAWTFQLHLHQIAAFATNAPLFLKFPVNNGGSFFPLLDLRSGLLSLPIRHPSGITVILQHEVDHVAATVAFSRRRVHGGRTVSTGIKRLLPGGCPLLQLFNQFFGYPSVMIIRLGHIPTPIQ